jgi:hypothetical protein
LISRISAAGGEGANYLWQEVFAVVAEDEGDAGNALDVSCCHLGETSDDGYLSVGVEAVGLADDGAALFFGDGRNGACINDIEVCRLVEVDNGVSEGRKTA